MCAGVAENSHLRSKNYFYYNCLTGKFRRDNCPSYLVEENFKKLKAGVIDGLTVATGTFMDELQARKYTKVRGLRAVAGVGKWKCGKDCRMWGEQQFVASMVQLPSVHVHPSP